MPGGEIYGLDACIAYCEALVTSFANHTAAGASGERYTTMLTAAGVTGVALASAHAMQQSVAVAVSTIEAHHSEMQDQKAVQEQYDANPDAGDKTFQTTDAGGAAAQLETPMTREQAEPQAPRGTFNPGQPRAADGKWIKVGDELGYADGENVHATGQVVGAGPVPTTLALIDYPDDGVNQQGAFVEVATPKNGYNPVTGQEGDGGSYCPPQLGPDEAETAAGHLEELAAMVESGYRPPTPTVHTRARQRIEMLMAEDRTASRDRIIVGDQDDFPLTTGQLLKLLNEADPTLSAPQTRHAVRAHAAVAGGGEDGTLWLDMEPDAASGMHIVVTAVEGTEDPDDDYNRQYTAQHTPETARELAGKLRAFARAARRRKRH